METKPKPKETKKINSEKVCDLRKYRYFN